MLIFFVMAFLAPMFIFFSTLSMATFRLAVLAFAWAALLRRQVRRQTALIRTQVFEVTNERVRWRRGLVTKRTDELELYRVMDVSLVEPFLLRLVGAGNIEVTSADASTPRLTLPAVKGAAELREHLRNAIEERAGLD